MGSMRRVWPVVAMLALELVGLRALAVASPPDPLWIAGIYDDADHDDVVQIIGSMDGLPDEAAPDLHRGIGLVGLVDAARPVDRPSVVHAAAVSRAPPSS